MRGAAPGSLVGGMCLDVEEVNRRDMWVRAREVHAEMSTPACQPKIWDLTSKTRSSCQLRTMDNARERLKPCLNITEIQA